MSSSALSVAVVGLGGAGSNLHLPALRDLPGCRLVAGCDLDAGLRRAVAEAWGIPVFDDYRRMVEEAAPDVVVVATPPDSHRGLVLEALAAGAHVVCEKPFVSSLREADELMAAADAAGRQIALNHEFREMPIFRALRREVESGEAGSLRFVQIWQLMDLPPWTEEGWRGRLPRRTLYEAGVHLVDYAMALFGAKPVAVQAYTSAGGAADPGVDAVSVVTLEFPGDRLAQILQDRLCRGETQYFEVRADLEHASLRGSFGGRARFSAGLFRSTRPHLRLEFGLSGMAWKEVGSRRTFLARNPKNPVQVATRRILEQSFEAFRTGSEPPVSASFARQVLEVVAACYRSAETGRRVRLDEPTAAALQDLDLSLPLSTGA